MHVHKSQREQLALAQNMKSATVWKISGMIQGKDIKLDLWPLAVRVVNVNAELYR